MRIEPLDLPGAFLLIPEPIVDERGFFARVFCSEEFEARGLLSDFRQSSVSFNARAGTIRGMHYSSPPHAETKIVRCTSGAIHDVLVDLRPRSPSYLSTISLELRAEERYAVYVPVGVAHGFQALEDATEVLYMIDVPYEPKSARGVRWNDPRVNVRWPLDISVISARDLSYPDLDISGAQAP